MKIFIICLIACLSSLSIALPTESPGPVSTPGSQEPAASNYVPHVTYPYADGYGPISPYEGYTYPVANYPVQNSYMSNFLPAAQGALQVALAIFAKVGLFLSGGVILLIVGGLFTTAVCSLTPLCTIQFNGLAAMNKETVRALMSPDKISTAAAIVQDAIGKYQRLQNK